MQSRMLVPELMDDPALDHDEHLQALRGLQRINAWTRNAALAWKSIRRLAVESRKAPLRILDIATGAADIPIAIQQRAARLGIPLEIEACDFSEQALSFAADNCSAAQVTIRLFRHDVLLDDIPDEYDVVMCSQFLHHLNDEQANTVLQTMKRAATRRVVVVDLERSYANLLQVWFATRVLSRSNIVHFDGPQSVRAAFKVSEFNKLVQSVGFASFEIQRKWPCRFVLIGETIGSA